MGCPGKLVVNDVKNEETTPWLGVQMAPGGLGANVPVDAKTAIARATATPTPDGNADQR